MSVDVVAFLRKSRELPREVLQVVATIVLVAGSLGFVALCNSLMRAYYKTLAPHSAVVAVLPLLVTAAVALIFVRWRYDRFSPLLRVALRLSGIGLLVFLLVEPPDFTLAAPEYAGDALYVNYAYYAAVAFAVIGTFSPSFILPTVLYITSTRRLIEGISGIPTSNLDMIYMLDISLYLCVFSIGFLWLRSKFNQDWDIPAREEDITFIAFGMHLGNYFWSGFAKGVAGPYFWTWPLENLTQNLIPYSQDKGALPIGHVPWLVQLFYDSMQTLILPINLAVIGFQLFALICVLRLSWLKIATLFYDLLHIGIYVFGGLFFWPWVWNNVTILVASNKLRTITTTAKIACIATIVLGNPWFGMYKSARLGWFDVADARQVYFQAVTDTGTARVPASFFLTHSFGMSLGYIDTAEHSGHYGHSIWNSSRNYNRQVTSGTCPPPAPDYPSRLETDQARRERIERIGRFIRSHHVKMLAREALYGKYSYYFRVHHHPSNPYLFKAFSAIDLQDVNGYELVLESACYRMKDGHFIKKVVAGTVERFDVR